MIGGNINAVVEKLTTTTNSIGEVIQTWTSLGTVLGWLDYQSGQADVSQYSGKIQDTTHIFLCDWIRWKTLGNNISSQNIRIVIDSEIYNVLHVDNPMSMNQHLEIYLQHVGGGISG